MSVTEIGAQSENMTRHGVVIARTPFQGTPPEGQDSVDLSSEMVALLASRNDFEANTKVVKTFDEMTKTLLNILG